MTTKIKPKIRLCCLMRPLGSCRHCKKACCSNHGKGFYDVNAFRTSMTRGRPLELLYVECRSPKCNDSIVKQRYYLERRREMRRAAGIPERPNKVGKELLDRITSQKIRTKRKHK